jgi:uncharacterized protein involved in exopolysaccharide biosynthesis
MENQQDIQEDEINVREYLNVIIKMKKLVLSIFLPAVVITIIVNLLMPKIYEITSTIQLGSVDELLIKNDDAKAMILNQNFLLSMINDFNLKITVEDLLKDIKINDIGGTNLLKLKITYHNIDTAFKINDAIVKPLVVQGQNMYQERLVIFNERLKELSAEIENAGLDITKTQSLISGLPNSSDISQSDVSLRRILLQNALLNYESNLISLRDKRNELKLLLANAKEFKLFDAPIKPKNPIGPKKLQNIFIVGMLSLIFSVFLAFILEFWQKSNER